MSIADKLTQIAENEQKVYDSGYSKAELDFWDIVTSKNTRTRYANGFLEWDMEYFRPPYKIVPISSNSARALFDGCDKLKKIESKYLDLSQKEISTVTSSTGYYYTFTDCISLTEVEDIGLGDDTYSSTFLRCYSLRTIAVLRPAQNTRWGNAFVRCRSLENLTIEGVIGENGFNVQECPLTHDSLMSIINALADYSADTSGTTWTVTLGPENIAKLTEEELDIIDTKGWVVA